MSDVDPSEFVVPDVDPRRICPTCRFIVDGPPYDIGSGPELCCSRCETCFGFNDQKLDPDDARRMPQELIDQLPEWARSSFIPKDS